MFVYLGTLPYSSTRQTKKNNTRLQTDKSKALVCLAGLLTMLPESQKRKKENSANSRKLASASLIWIRRLSIRTRNLEKPRVEDKTIMWHVNLRAEILPIRSEIPACKRERRGRSFASPIWMESQHSFYNRTEVDLRTLILTFVVEYRHSETYLTPYLTSSFPIFFMTSFWCRLKCIATMSTLSIDIRALLNQQFYYLLMTFIWCRMECIAIVSTLSIDIRALLNQEFYYLFKTSIWCCLKCIVIFSTLRTNISAPKIGCWWKDTSLRVLLLFGWY